MNTSRTISFDGWVLDRDVGELVKDGRKTRLQQRPLLVLDELLANPGVLVTREQLIARLWPKGVVDFDTGLNTAVRKLRVALDDVGEVPRYIETIPRRGYRFVGTIDEAPTPAAAPPADVMPVMPQPEAVPEDVPESTAPPLPIVAPENRPALPPFVECRKPAPARAWPKLVGLCAAVALAGGAAYYFVQRQNRSPQSVLVTAGPEDEDLTIALLPLDAASKSDADGTFSEIVGDALRQRLGRIEKATVIGTNSTPRSVESTPTGAAAKEHYLLKGKATRNGAQVHVALELVDARSGRRQWSFDEERAEGELAALIDAAVRRIAGFLHVRADPGTVPQKITPINLQAYEIFLRAQSLMRTQRVGDGESALELFRRATTLDGSFARGYLGIAQALAFANGSTGLTQAESAKLRAEAMTSCDHALALDPGLGECLIERARVTEDSAEADRLFRQGLALAPNYGVGWQRYSEFLFDEYRRGEALGAVERAHEIDPLEPRVALRFAVMRYYIDSDTEAHDRVASEVIAANPKMVSAIEQLSMSRWYNRGAFAEAIRLDEQAVQLDPDQDDPKVDLSSMYLEVGDPAAARAVLKLCARVNIAAQVDIALFERDPRRAVQLVRDENDEEWRTHWDAPEAWALRDEAIRTGDFAYALERMDKRFALNVPWGPAKTVGPRYWNRTLGVVYAHTLVLAGEAQRGRKLAQTVLAQLDSESVGRAQYYNSRDRAAALMILGDKEGALRELKNSLSINHYNYWWYYAELDPLYAELRPDPRFQALVKQWKEHVAQQRALLDEMRRSGQVPDRVKTAKP